MATNTSFGMNPNILNNAVIMRQTKFDPKKFTDLNFLYNNYTKDSFTVYKGLLSLWNQRSIINTPLLEMTEMTKSVMYLPNTEGRFRYSIPYRLGLPYVVENLEADNVAPGKDGQTFKIKLSENCYSNTDILTVDMRDGIQVYVTDEEIIEESDGTIYTVELVGTSRRNLSYPQEFMQPGKQYMKIQNVNGEYDTQMSSISSENLRTGFMDLEMEVGGGHRSVTHWITGYADMCRVDESKHPSLAYINQKLEKLGGVTLYYNAKPDGTPIKGSVSWHNTVEMLLRAEMEQMTENGLMWAQGGFVSGGQGRRKVRVGAGLYQQLRNGNRQTYNTISLELIEQNVANLFANSGIPIEQRHTKIMTGQGGLNQIAKDLNARLQQYLGAGNYLTQTKDAAGGNILYGDAMNAGFRIPRFTKFFSHTAGWIEFVHNPSLDNMYGNREQDGLIGEYPITSYTYMILDITDASVSNAAARVNSKVRVEDGFNNGSNVVLIKPQDYGELYWGYIMGTHSPFGPTDMKGMQSANSYPGYQIWMKSFGSIWVKDVTRTLLLEKTRPGYLLVDYPSVLR